MEEALLAHLQPHIASLVADRVQWGVREQPPCVVLHLIDAPPDWHLTGPSGVVIARVQADCCDTTFLAAKAIGNALIAALPPVGSVVIGVKFLGAQPIDLARDTLGAPPNLLHRTRIDVRVSFRPA